MALQNDGFCPLLQVFDMPASVRFYQDVLGFELTEPVEDLASCDWVLLRKDGSHLMLNTAYERQERPAQPDPNRMAAHADTALFFSCPDVDGAYQEARRLGLRVEPPMRRDYGMKQLYLQDPDGYEICLQCPDAAVDAGS